MNPQDKLRHSEQYKIGNDFWVEEKFGSIRSLRCLHCFGLQVEGSENYKFHISWLEVVQGPKAVKLTVS